MTDTAPSLTDYDELPYVSLPIPFAQPARLAALAHLYGLSPPDAGCARVLEIGCASGGNLIPLAARFPEARFTGLDLSTRQIADGVKRSASAGLHNVALRAGDVRDFKAEAQSFDYILCHGVFSWVAPAAQDAILDICANALAPDGLALISYNVLPGWHFRQIVRDICLSETAGIQSAKQRVIAARRILDSFARGERRTDAFGRAVQDEAVRLAKQPASYIMGEYLAPHNAPIAFRDMVERVRRVGLAYVCEADLAATLPANIAPSAAGEIQRLAGADRIAQQHYADVFSGRTFRRSVFSRASCPPPKLTSTGATLTTLQMSSPLKRAAQTQNTGGAVFQDHKGRSLTVGDPHAAGALDSLAAAYPASVDAARLLEDAKSHGGASAEEALRKILMSLLARGSAIASTVPLCVGRAADDLPKLFSIARGELKAGQPWVTTLRHTAVLAPKSLSLMGALMDGTRRRSELLDIVVKLSSRTTVDGAPHSNGHVTAATAKPGADIAADFDTLLDYLAVNGLLEPG